MSYLIKILNYVKKIYFSKSIHLTLKDCLVIKNYITTLHTYLTIYVFKKETAIKYPDTMTYVIEVSTTKLL
jgi:hypothetical protein